MAQEKDVVNENEIHELEESLQILDVRLSVIGTQFKRRPNDEDYPDLYNLNEGDTDSLPSSNTNVQDGPGSLRTVDVVLDGLEWGVLKGVGWVSSFLGNQPVEETQDGKQGKDFEVVQTNWYGRQQTRILRVCPKELQRVHPMSGAVRYAVPLSKIVGMSVSKDGSTLQVIFIEEQRDNGLQVVVTDTYTSLYTQQIINSIHKYRKINVKTI
jgi:hypothetical protein